MLIFKYGFTSVGILFWHVKASVFLFWHTLQIDFFMVYCIWEAAKKPLAGSCYIPVHEPTRSCHGTCTNRRNTGPTLPLQGASCNFHGPVWIPFLLPGVWVVVPQGSPLTYKCGEILRKLGRVLGNWHLNSTLLEPCASYICVGSRSGLGGWCGAIVVRQTCLSYPCWGMTKTLQLLPGTCSLLVVV